MVVSATLAPAGSGTKVAVSQDLQLAGAADVTAVLMRDFATNLARQITAAERGEAVQAAAAPAGGLAIGMRAALMALRRVYRRFFLPYQAAS